MGKRKQNKWYEIRDGKQSKVLRIKPEDLENWPFIWNSYRDEWEVKVESNIELETIEDSRQAKIEKDAEKGLQIVDDYKRKMQDRSRGKVRNAR
jgi:hypothetical protein